MSNLHHPLLQLKILVALCMSRRTPQNIQKQITETAFTLVISEEKFGNNFC
jgi:mitochondrial fission protein ELM1